MCNAANSHSAIFSLSLSLFIQKKAHLSGLNLLNVSPPLPLLPSPLHAVTINWSFSQNVQNQPPTLPEHRPRSVWVRTIVSNSSLCNFTISLHQRQAAWGLSVCECVYLRMCVCVADGATAALGHKAERKDEINKTKKEKKIPGKRKGKKKRCG